VKTTRDKILEKAIDLFTAKGYYNTSMADLADACNLQKGSFYHYFSDKETLMKEAIFEISTRFSQKTLSAAYDLSLSPTERLFEILHRNVPELLKHYGCFIGNSALETANTEMAFRNLISDFFTKWINALALVYQTKYESEISNQMALQTVQEVEGAIMMMRVYRDESYLMNALDRITNRF
jgi:TetR/AcrR family transcriptional repressor of nem operon